jgi:hypothetical protein
VLNVIKQASENVALARSDRLGGQRNAEPLAYLAVGQDVDVPEYRLDVPAHHLDRGWSPVIGPSVLEEGHELAQRFKELGPAQKRGGAGGFGSLPLSSR